jgi:hypothetical protein
MFKYLSIMIPMALAAQESPPSAMQTAALPTNTRSVLVMEAKARAEDILKAYDLLKKEKPTLKISAKTYSGQVLSNIVDIIAMPNGTMLLFRLSSTQGLKNQMISVDDILELFYS